MLWTPPANLPAGVLVGASDREVLAVTEALPAVVGLPLDAEAVAGADSAAALREVSDVSADPGGVLARAGGLLETRERVDGERVAMVDGRVVERCYVPHALPDGEAGSWRYRDVTDRE